MPNGNGALDFEAILKTTDFKKELGDLERRITGFSSKAVSETKKVDDTFSKLTTAAAGIFAANQLSQLPGQIIKVRGEYQKLEISLTTILKSKSAADKVLADGAKLAATTPFTFTEVGQGIKQLLAYGSTAGNVVNEVRTLGDVAAGVSAPLGDLIYLYGTLKTQGRAYTVDIRQFAGRGIPIYSELAKVLKINTDEVNNFVEAGKVGFKEVEQVFKNLTSSGGQFEGLTQKTSKSLTGLLSNLQDNVEQAFNKIGQSQEGLLASGILTATELVQNYEKIIDVLKVVVATYGTYRAALLISAAVQAVQNIGILIQGYVNLSTALGPLTAQQLAFNSAVSINPYVLLATVIVGLAAAFYVLSDRTTAAEKATESLNRLEEQSSKIKADLTSKTNELVSSIKSETSTRLTQLDSFQKLQAMYPSLFANMDLDTYKKLDATAAQKELNKAIEANDTKRLEQNFDNAKKKSEELQKTVADLSEALSLSGNQGGGIKKTLEDSKKSLEAAKIEAQKLGEEVAKRKQLEYEANTPIEQQIKNYENTRIALEAKSKSLQDIIAKEKLINQGGETMKSIFANISLQNVNNELSDVLLKLTKINSGDVNPTVNNKAYYEGIKKTNQDLLDGLAYNQKGSAEWKKYSAAVAEAEKKLQAWSGTSKKAVTKKSEEVFKEGSIKYFEQIAQKAQEVIEKTPFTNTAIIEKQQEIRLNAEEQAEKLRRSLVTRSFDEELDYKRQQYELYNSWVVYQGKVAADGQFAELVKSGASYKDFLQSEISTLEGKLTAGTATPQDKSNLVKAKVALDIDNESFDKYKSRIIDTGEQVATLTDYLRILKQEQDKLSSGDVDKSKFLAEEIVSIERQRKQLLKDFIIENNVGGAEVLKIQQYYSELKSELDKQYTDKKSASYQEALDKINKSEKEALAEQAANNVEKNNKVYKELTKIVDTETRKQLVIKINSIKQQLSILEQAGAKESESYQNLTAELKGLFKSLKEGDIRTTNELFSIAGQIGSEFSNVDGIIGDIGKSLTFASSQASGLLKIFKGGATGLDIANFGATVLSGIVSSIVEQKKLNKELYDSKIKSQTTYNFLLNEQIRLNSIINQNGFTKDYEGIVGDAQKALVEANKIYLGLIKDIEFSRGAILKRNAGFLGIGAFNDLGPTVLVYKDLIKTAIDGTKELNIERAKALIDNNLVDERTKGLLQNAIDAQKLIDDAQKQIDDVITDLTGQLGSILRDNLVNAFKDGTSAAKAFGDSVGQVLENVISQTLFSAVFNDAFDLLKADLKSSYDGGDGIITDDLEKFYQTYPDLINDFTKGLSDAKSEAEKAGIDIFKNGTGSGASSNSLSGAVKGITEETAGLIAGQFNALRITSASTLQVNRDQLLALTNISNNSNFLKKLDLLESIDKKLGNSSVDELRAGGL